MSSLGKIEKPAKTKEIFDKHFVFYAREKFRALQCPQIAHARTRILDTPAHLSTPVLVIQLVRTQKSLPEDVLKTLIQNERYRCRLHKCRLQRVVFS